MTKSMALATAFAAAFAASSVAGVAAASEYDEPIGVIKVYKVFPKKCEFKRDKDYQYPLVTNVVFSYPVHGKSGHFVFKCIFKNLDPYFQPKEAEDFKCILKKDDHFRDKADKSSWSVDEYKKKGVMECLFKKDKDRKEDYDPYR